METRFRPKSDFMQVADWPQLHALSERWLTQLTFYGDEIRFFKDLISKYFVWLVADEKMDSLTSLSKRLIKIEQENQHVLHQTTRHMGHLVALMKNSFSSDQQQFRDEHSLLEDRMTELSRDFVSLKKDLFKVTKRVIKTERLKRLLPT